MWLRDATWKRFSSTRRGNVSSDATWKRFPPGKRFHVATRRTGVGNVSTSRLSIKSGATWKRSPRRRSRGRPVLKSAKTFPRRAVAGETFPRRVGGATWKRLRNAAYSGLPFSDPATRRGNVFRAGAKRFHVTAGPGKRRDVETFSLEKRFHGKRFHVAPFHKKRRDVETGNVFGETFPRRAENLVFCGASLA